MGQYYILPVNSCGYCKFQVEIGAVTNQDLCIEIACKHTVNLWFSTLNYVTTIQVRQLSEAQLLTSKIWYMGSFIA